MERWWILERGQGASASHSVVVRRPGQSTAASVPRSRARNIGRPNPRGPVRGEIATATTTFFISTACD